MATPKGYLVVPLAFNASGDPVALEVDASNYLAVTAPDIDTVLSKLSFDANNYLQVYDMATLTPYGARVIRTTDQVIPNNAVTAISFDTEIDDDGNMFDAVTQPTWLTCKSAGWYIISASARFASGAASTRRLELWINGSILIAQMYDDVILNQAYRQTISALYKLALNDYIQFFVLQNTGGNLNCQYVASYSPVLAAVKVV